MRRKTGLILQALSESSSSLSFADLAMAAAASPDELQLILDLLRSFPEDIKISRSRVQLRHPLELLDEQKLYHHTGGRGRISVVPLIDSTNSELLRCVDNAVSGDVLAAEIQTAGRGRRGSSWHSSLGGQLTFSLCWKFPDVSAVLGLPVVCGLAVISALSDLQAQPLLIKWPNDIYQGDGKLSGMLVELKPAVQPGGGEWAVVGIGLNLRVDERLRAAAGGRQIAALSDGPQPLPGRSEILARLISALREHIALFAREGLQPFLPLWQEHDYLRDHVITVELEDGSRLQGRSAGIDDKGRLQLALPDGSITIVAAGHIPAWQRQA